MFPWLSSGASGRPRAQPRVESATIGTVGGHKTLRSDPGPGAPPQPPLNTPARPPPGHGKRDSRMTQSGRVWGDMQFSAALVLGMSPVFTGRLRIPAISRPDCTLPAAAWCAHAVNARAVCDGSDFVLPQPGFLQGNQQMLAEGLTPTGASSVESLSGSRKTPRVPLSLRK